MRQTPGTRSSRPLRQRVDVFVDACADLGVGPCWDPERDALAWVDIVTREVHVSDGSATLTHVVPAPVGAAVPSADGGLLLALGVSFAALDLDRGTLRGLASVSGDPQRIRMNDGKVDPAGRFWAGTTAYDGTRGEGVLYRLDGPGRARPLVAPVTVSSGLGWSPTGDRMYFVDSPRRSVAVFDFDVAGGRLGRRRTLVDTRPHAGVPGGLAVDELGNVWVAFTDGAAVRCFDGDGGRLLAELPLPVQRPTSCAFGGPDGRLLLVTTARRGLAAQALAAQPLAGSVLALEPGICGPPSTPARGQGR
ncbi:SMP-30/gluconolactonase/LRE family protein [Conexibacter woesei]|uniref:SMP-30/Gluconolaconase/LRE domain protein n=1 Tax=Conexibacter woesei (strain DSM 14684 / CCUG 47730 / CIP 108061 / JCM 11494 / NBRC 100937 / ID131577) TaxID=469383 RepID=D3F723_CONWI|nr:SMP-30/gluconolactonase/LRE family protein [Conexibacter woesei]ADB48794.1 SMP-30/Gluconolaconase/LRE domain protein [Conexibacter woesei DSM 14684]